VNVFYLKPKNKLRITTLNNKQESLKETIQQGFSETCDDLNLRKFLEA
jgi:hypothetical protein